MGINSRLVDEKCVNQMNYLKCVIKETMRLHTLIPLLVARETTSNVKLRLWYSCQKKDIYQCMGYPKLWDSPEEFIPERFEISQVDLNG